MSGTWILVAHRGGAHIYLSDGPKEPWELVESHDHPDGRLKDGDIDTDAPGQNIDRGAPRNYDRSERPTERVAANFARELAQRLTAARNEGAFDRLVLVAAPTFLGHLRDSMDAPTAAMVVESLDKNYPDPVPDVVRAALRERIVV